VRDLNQAARDRLRDAGELGQDVRISAERGARDFASGDRIMFLKNERELGVKNGTLGKVERVSPDSMAVRLTMADRWRSTSRIMPMSITAMPPPSTNRRA
jgi:ATP-dependent exoDNAse (exonuclease V) alpha subunit